MSGSRWFWALVGYIVYIVVLIFLYFYKPFEDLFTLVMNGVGYDNAIFWVVILTAIVGFCAFHWRAYRLHIVQQHSVEKMVLASLRGSTFIALLLSAGTALQSMQIICVYLLQDGYTLDRGFGARLVAVIAPVILTAVFCVIFWLLSLLRPVPGSERIPSPLP
jgi:hypothetical protein